MRTRERLKIGIVAPPWFAVPPERYGGVEWVVSLLADGLADLGHDVTLHAAGGSISRAHLDTTFDEPQAHRVGRTLPELEHTLAAWSRSQGFDIVNDHSGMLGAAMADLCPSPVCHTVHSALDGESGRIYSLVAQTNPRLRFISLSIKQREPLPLLPWLANCPSALDLDAYPFSPRRGDYLMFLGRMSPDKGAADAIRVAEAIGMPLKIAGKMHEPHERDYFAHEIAPHLSSTIEYVGEVSHLEKVRLLQGARCTLFPIDWEEPFCLAMIEAMACGSPVVATRRGAVDEVIADGISGLIVDTVDELAAAVEQADAIDAQWCRDHVEEHFSDRRMVRRYLEAYRAMLDA
jgi:glycosyltransferase involved in cell wall biosynthesis